MKITIQIDESVPLDMILVKQGNIEIGRIINIDNNQCLVRQCGVCGQPTTSKDYRNGVIVCRRCK